MIIMISRAIATITKPHGLKGAMHVQLNCANAINLLKSEKVTINNSDIEIEEIFGHVQDKCIIKFVGYDYDAVQILRACNLMLVSYDATFLEDYIGSPVIKDNFHTGNVKAIHDFGAGVIIETEKEMISIGDLKFDNGIVIFQ